MWEVFTGILGGARSTIELIDMKHLGESMGLSLYLQAIDPSAFMSLGEFTSRVEGLIDQVHANPPMAGGDPVRVPGESKAGIAAERERDGVPVTTEMVERFRELGDEFGVSWD